MAASSSAAASSALSWGRQDMLSSQVRGPSGATAVCQQRQRQGSRRLPVVCATGTSVELAGVLSFSTFPFLAVTALANSGLGKWLSDRLDKERERLEADRLLREVARERARFESPFYGEKRPRVYGVLPLPYPKYLDGTLPGDFGFDPLGLAREPQALDKYFNLEVIHGRWAMLGALGALIPELLVRYGGYQFLDPVWWSVGYAKLQGDDLDYLGIPGLHIAGNQGVAIIAVAQALLMLGPEYARYTGIKALEPLGIYLPGDKNYPGGWLFDPLNISGNPGLYENLRVREMKNARLAMLAWVGFAVQAWYTGKSPLENWDAFLADPEKNNALAAVLGDLRGYPDYVALKESVIEGVQQLQGTAEYREAVAVTSSNLSEALSSKEFQEVQAAVLQLWSQVLATSS